MSDDLKKTPLNAWHRSHGGRMVPFAGWEMPVRYDAGALEEHRMVRRSAGLFDIDHMGQIAVSGPDAEAFLNRLVTWDVSTIAPGTSHYALMCLPTGGVVDDVFVYRRADHWFVVVNASNREKDLQWMLAHTAGFSVTVSDVSDQTAMLALQGPRALELLAGPVGPDLETVPRFGSLETSLWGIPAFLGRTGYTGEDGAELFVPVESAVDIWEGLLAAGIRSEIEVLPIGLAARNSLRFEPGFPLYGHEIDAETTPLEANLGWACRLEKDFIGRDALVKQKEAGLNKKLIGFELTEPGVPRQGCVVTDEGGRPVGAVVEGLYAPTADKYCGHAFVPPALAAVGTKLLIEIRDKPKAAVVIRRPFYQPSYKEKA